MKDRQSFGCNENSFFSFRISSYLFTHVSLIPNMMPYYITILHFAQGALVGGGIAPASDPLLSALRRGNAVVAEGSLEIA